VRATVDRAGLDSESRTPHIKIRRVRKGDLSKVRDVIEQSFADYFERQLGTRPRQVFGGAQYVHHRWLMEPWGCFVAEENDGKIVGAIVAVMWGSVGLVGPVAVLTNYQNQDIGTQLLRAAQDFFDENHAVLTGVVTYPTSAKHLALYHKLGYRPKSLVAIMSRSLDRPQIVVVPGRPGKAGLAVRRFSSLEESKKKAVMQRFRRITNAIHRGLDLAKEIEIVDGLALGDTYVLESGRELAGFAICHTPGVSEAPAGAFYIKYLVLDRRHRKPEHFDAFMTALEQAAHEAGLSRVIAPVYLAHFAAYQALIARGYQIDFTMLRMKRGRQEDDEDPADFVLDDWR
jgi:ribosomal protein S18 acetylase RimI-like enzyme